MDESKKLINDIPHRIFFLGICGIGMSALAQYLKIHCDKEVAGSDQNTHTDIGAVLLEQGIQLYQEADIDEILLDTFDCLVVTNIIFKKNHILELAQKKNKLIIQRSKLLQLVLADKKVIGITGSHGKTTTTGLTTKIFKDGGLSPLGFVGGIVSEFENNFISGKSDLAIVEADDAFKSFLDLEPFFSVITTISTEHLETYKNLEEIKDTFVTFANNTAKEGGVVINIDEENTQEVALKIDHPHIITYGTNKNAHYCIQNISFDKDKSYFEIHKNNNFLGKFTLSLSGVHNVKNATAAIIVALENNISLSTIAKSLNTHQGVKRRFEFLGTTSTQLKVYDDYGHHPKEIETVFNILEIKKFRYVYIFFQLHRYSRTQHLWNEFIAVFEKYRNQITCLFTTDIYSAGEVALDENYTAEKFAQILQNKNINVLFFPEQSYFQNFLLYKRNLIHPIDREQDIILTLGAGLMNHFASAIIEKMSDRQ